MVRPANSPGSPLVQGQIRLTAQQIAGLTSQQIVIRPGQNGVQQQILISRPATSTSSVPASLGSPPPQYTKVQPSLASPVQSFKVRPGGGSPGQVSVSGNSVQYTTVNSQGKSVVTYLRQVRPDQPAGMNLQNIKLSGQNVRFSTSINGPGNMILTPTGPPAQPGVIRLGTKSVPASPQPTPATLANHTRLPAPTISMSNTAVTSTVGGYQLGMTSISGVTLHKQKPNIVRSSAKMIAPRTVQSSGVKNNLVGVQPNNIVYKQGPGNSVSLLSQSQGEARVQDAASKEGLQLITADGKFIDTEGLHLLSPNGTVLKAESLLQTISSTSKLSPEKQQQRPRQQAPIPLELNTQQLISHLQQPLPYQATSLSLSLPPPQVVSSAPPHPPLQLLSPVTSSLPPLLSPSSSVLLSPPRLLDSSPLKLSPPVLLQRPPVTSIQSLLPTQPLLPSQIRGLAPVARPLNFSSRPAATSTPRARAKTKKESMRAKVAKLESNLNTAPLLALIDQRGQAVGQEALGQETELEREFLLGVEAEARGDILDTETVEVKENYYKHNKVNRYLKLNTTASDSDESGEEPFEDGHIMNLLKVL